MATNVLANRSLFDTMRETLPDAVVPTTHPVPVVAAVMAEPPSCNERCEDEPAAAFLYEKVLVAKAYTYSAAVFKASRCCSSTLTASMTDFQSLNRG